jgi:glycine/D-amino acid oxidase-like deaminating enzyme/nitrite reductase/ring-hydroxylating ferredoxin subunit
MSAPPNPSYWIETTPETSYPSLQEDISVDVAIIGGGITGITAGTLLKREGKTVALLDSKRIVHGATGYTTGKVTAGHGAVYADLQDNFGAEGARIYAESNNAAVDRVAKFVEEDGIDCDFERKANYVYAGSNQEVAALKAEVEAERRAGLPVSLVDETPLPYWIAAAIRLENQAQFHPRKYLLALAATIPGDGSHVFEETIATDVKNGEPCVVETDRGVVRARDVILATHLPFEDSGLFFAKAHPHRSYAVAAPLDEAKAPDGMFINSGIPTRSVRTIRDGERLLIQVGGQGHKPGEEEDTPARYEALEEFLKENWPDAGASEYRWSTQDYMSVDRVPYIGRLRRTSKHVYAATGYSKWGMTSGTLAGLLLTDRILERENPWADLYDAKRIKPKASFKRFLSGNASVGRHFVADRLKRAEPTEPESLAHGEGGILRVRGRKRAAYRDDAGTLHILSPVCTHRYCHVAWNPAERSWDCPCHGSRYSGEGDVIQGPAVKPLKRLDDHE